MQFIISLVCLSILLNAINWFYGKPKIPPRLDQIASRIAQGNVPKKYDLILREKITGYREHYTLVAGRMCCRAEPYYDRTTKESVYALVIGFKEHVSSPADKYITIPVYKNGNLYE